MACTILIEKPHKIWAVARGHALLQLFLVLLITFRHFSSLGFLTLCQFS